MNKIVILNCPNCGQGMFIKTDYVNEDFVCISNECKAKLKVSDIKGELGLIKIKKDCATLVN